jgi:uncharacterized glyoxalase superfamily protein PhnB
METSINFGAITPVVPAADMERSLRFYVETLGFEERFRSGAPLDYAGVVRDLATLHLFSCTEPKIAEWTAFRIGVDDLDALYARCVAAGIVHPNGAIGERPWGSRDFSVIDPAGVCITFWQRTDSEKA